MPWGRSRMTSRTGLAWRRRAASIGAWRELSGYHDPADPIGPEPSRGHPDIRAAWHEALAALGPADGPDVRGMTDGTLLHLRDTYPIETAWAPQWGGDELRQVRLAARTPPGRTAIRRPPKPRHPPPGQHEQASRESSWPPATRPCTTLTASARPCSPPSWPTAPTGSGQPASSGTWPSPPTPKLRRRPRPAHPPLRSAEPEPPTQARRGRGHSYRRGAHSPDRPVDHRTGRAAPRLRR